jgi:hypothetical protein
MIMAETGGSLKVIGSKREMEAAGPSPGRTPTKLPIRQPRKQRRRFRGSRATLKAK